MWPQTRGYQSPPLPQGSGCTLAFRESEINEVDSIMGKPPVLPSLDPSVCLFPMPSVIPKSVCGLLNCQVLESTGGSGTRNQVIALGRKCTEERCRDVWEAGHLS